MAKAQAMPDGDEMTQGGGIHLQVSSTRVHPELIRPPLTCRSSSSVSPVSPAGFGGRLANSSGVKLLRYSGSFHARAISTAILNSLLGAIGGNGDIVIRPPLEWVIIFVGSLPVSKLRASPFRKYRQAQTSSYRYRSPESRSSPR
jgi:hypothetical protein